jgi:hypothetical protein
MQEYLTDLILDKLPVAVNPPLLQSITEESVKITVDLEYGVKATMPDFWQVQYKEVNESVYKNDSAPLFFFS